MTLIHPHQEKSIFIIAIVFLFAMLFTGVIWLIFLYNQSVDFRHGAADAKSQIQTVQLQNVEGRDALFSSLNGSMVENFALARGLIQEKNPRYVRAYNDTPWVFASRF